MNKGVIALLLASVLMLPIVFALGVSPARKTLQYTPGAVEKVRFAVVNSGSGESNVVVAVQGELAGNIVLDETNFVLQPGEEKNVEYTVKIPEGLSPGLHTAEIVILELPKKGELKDTFIGAALAIATELNVNVPYPGKYAEGTLSVFPRADGNVDFVIPVLNKGDFDLIEVMGDIEIQNQLGEEVASLSTSKVSIESGKRRDLVATWEAEKDGSPPGNYHAVATVFYDEDTLTLEKDFRIGKKVLSLENIEVNDFTLGEIAKFEITVKNNGNEEVKNAFTNLLVRNEHGDLVEEMKSPTHDIPAGEKTLMFTYWDTQGARVGTYPSELYLKYGQETQPAQELEVQLFEDKIVIVGFGFVLSDAGEGFSAITYLTIAVVVLIIINLSWFVFLRKRFVGGRK